MTSTILHKQSFKKIKCYIACILSSAAVYAEDSLIFDKKRFPRNPIQGTFVVTETIPDLSTISASKYHSNVFMPHQIVEFEYDGEVGSDWEGYFEYNMTIFPPYDKRMCNQDHWLHYCNEIPESKGMPKEPITQTLILSASLIENQKDINELKEIIPYGLKLGDYIYGGNTSDGGVVYDSLYFKDWNTLISLINYYDENSSLNGLRKSRVKSAIQILKRENKYIKIPHNKMVKSIKKNCAKNPKNNGKNEEIKEIS